MRKRLIKGLPEEQAEAKRNHSHASEYVREAPQNCRRRRTSRLRNEDNDRDGRVTCSGSASRHTLLTLRCDCDCEGSHPDEESDRTSGKRQEGHLACTCTYRRQQQTTVYYLQAGGCFISESRSGRPAPSSQ
ncbi:uncharacterized protein RAG0_14878 [Rhynchosporium agropyri]|uniref:Uncharacterized protein n=1 Tax=Rhynchosporium agropyri TaxID=914238 RepID=A0A1E1LIQ6_9HELO|nr:uncharacterized protein RAG0_14878 [Rhynchosporium agropyri]